MKISGHFPPETRWSLCSGKLSGKTPFRGGHFAPESGGQFDRILHLILAHNHPSGNLNPSEADIQLTRKLKEAGLTLDMPVLDHLIISSEGYYSFADEGLL